MVKTKSLKKGSIISSVIVLSIMFSFIMLCGILLFNGIKSKESKLFEISKKERLIENYVYYQCLLSDDSIKLLNEYKDIEDYLDGSVSYSDYRAVLSYKDQKRIYDFYQKDDLFLIRRNLHD